VKIDNFFAELKRRNVYNVAVAYVVAGWCAVLGARPKLWRRLVTP
jgi:hypothetical protein